jgi:uncharacterized protein (TIGR02757 family)
VLSRAAARRLKPLLDAFVEERPWEARITADPVEFVHQYHQPRDVELAGLLAASLAYGRANLFKPKVRGLLERMGRSPATFVAEASIAQLSAVVEGFVYRFNLAADVAVLLSGAGAALRHFGSLEALFLDGHSEGVVTHTSLATFARRLKEGAAHEAIRKRCGPVRGLHHLLPVAQGGAAKRLNLYLRWMVRGPDAIDCGIWRGLRPDALVIPVDTHIQRIAQWLGFTTRNDVSWRTAEEITAGLRLLDVDDPVRYDFALCHYGMSGACPATPVKANCQKCPLRSVCRVGRRLD